MTLPTEVDVTRTPFSGGFRLQRSWPQSPGDSVPTELDWSFCRPAIDRTGRPVALVDIPVADSATMGPQSSDSEWFDPVPVVATDARAPQTDGLGNSGIEMDGAAYWPCGDCPAPCWQQSHQLGRLRGHVVLARGVAPRLADFETYLLRLNQSVRFARLGWLDDGIALQVVLPSDNRYWRTVAQDALVHVSVLLRPQAAWWDQPWALVEDLFHQARL